MAVKNNSWGIEVGSNAIKAVHLTRHGDDVAVTGYDVIPFKKVLTTPDLNVSEAVQLKLDQFLSRHDVRKSNVVVSVPGNAAFAKFAKLPPVEPKKIPDIVKFEAVQQIPFPIEQVEWDYQVFAQADSPDVEVGIFAITKERLAQQLSNYHAVGMNIDGLTLSALAVYNAVAYDRELTDESKGLCLMDIGTSNTDVIIIDGPNLWLRTLPIGGNNFTQALMRAFKLRFNKAEKLKREAGTSKYARQIFQAMRPVFSDIVQELQRTLGYYQSLYRDAQLTKLIGFGSTFRLPGLQKYLKQHLQIEVLRHDTFHRITVEGKQAADFADQTLNLATAYGLALQGLGMERVGANLLPDRLIRQRLWRSKQPWIAAAAGLMIIASGLAWMKYKMDRGDFETSLAASTPRINQVLTEANGYVKQLRQIEGTADPRHKIEALLRILDYRDLWPKLMQDLTLAARALDPQPQLLKPDYAAMAAIPLDQRRRLYIHSLTAQYLANTDNDRPATATPPPTARPPGPQGPTDRQQAPSITITLKGTTPYTQGADLLSQHFIPWLQQNAQRRDRPYRIVNTKDALVDIHPLDHPSASATHRADRRARASDAPSRTDIGSLFPDRPEPHAAHTGWSFEIRWTVQLVPPDDARVSESGQVQQPTGAPPGVRRHDQATGSSTQRPEHGAAITPDPGGLS